MPLRLKNWDEVISVDQPAMNPVTNGTNEVMKYAASCGRYRVDNVRHATGRIHTTREYENYRQRILDTPLP